MGRREIGQSISPKLWPIENGMFNVNAMTNKQLLAPHTPQFPNQTITLKYDILFFLHSLPSLNTLPHMRAYTHTYICMYTHILTSDMSQLTNVNQIVVLNGRKHTSDEKRVSQNSLGLSTDCVDERNGCRVIRIVYVHIHTPRKGLPYCMSADVGTSNYYY